MVKYIKVTDREYRYSNRCAKCIQKTLTSVEAENKILDMYYNVTLGYYEFSQRKREDLENENAKLYTKYYDELYRINNESQQFSELNDKHCVLRDNYEKLRCEYEDLTGSIQGDKVYSGRIL